jgi:hypothetical protein
MLREPGSVYQGGRSSSLLKVSSGRREEEAVRRALFAGGAVMGLRGRVLAGETVPRCRSTGGWVPGTLADRLPRASGDRQTWLAWPAVLQAGKGRHQGRVGALELEMANGKRFKVSKLMKCFHGGGGEFKRAGGSRALTADCQAGSGLTDANREAPPAIGAIVTYRFQV